jgi:drug/metabolite transporter (DMT)-like permease
MLINTILLVAVSLAWSVGYLFIRDAQGVLPPITGTAIMAGVASVVMVATVLLLRRPLLQPLRQRAWLPLVMGFTAIAIPNFATVKAEETVEADLAAVLGTTVPILTFLITVFITRQTAYSPVRILGVAVAVAGLVVFVGWDDLDLGGREVGGMLIMMSGGLVFAINGIVLGKQTKDIDEYALAAWTMVFGTIALTTTSLAIHGLPPRPGSDVLWSLVGEGIIGMGLAYLGYFVLVARAGAYFGSLYAFLVPPFGVIAATLAFGGRLTAAHVVGVAIILAGLAMMRRRPAAEA